MLVVVKIGGSAITDKSKLETLKQEQLDATARQIAASFAQGTRFVVVHGAGSFGHQQAKQHGVKGGLSQGGACGFAAVRRSVTLLNHRVVSSLVEAGLPAVALPSFPSWTCAAGELEGDGVASVRAALGAGMLPVMHGDAVLDSEWGCTILSGDSILGRLAGEGGVGAGSAVFLTDVEGVLDGPPGEEGSRLVPVIGVDAVSGAFQVPRTSHNADVDVTGGMRGKVEAAAGMARHGNIPVYIVGVGGEDAEEALRGGRPAVCTVVATEPNLGPSPRGRTPQ